MIINSFVFGSTIDADAQAFFTASGITDPTIKSAINQLVVDLKAAGVWTKFYALYPFVGGTAGTHKWNLKSPVDADANYRLTYSGGLTHSATGMLPNGSTGFANTHFAIGTNGVSGDSSLAFYSRTLGMGLCDFGVATGLNANQMFISLGAVGGNFLCDTYAAGSERVNVAITNAQGLFTDTRRSTTVHEAYRNGSSIGTDGSTSVGAASITDTYYIGARNNTGTADSFSNHECAFAAIGNGLTSGEVSDLYTAVQAFQTTLSRQV